ncbi:gamma-glutamyltranspeptidase/glutathione hydrolase [Bacillus thermophilus]|uniref:Gamma-glutamyltranspeptidase/glutathione hydrolase n=1 Tax=Siminovitchia thermophila TaxID=1245522 RepID=A0ABS2R4E0_9BACI|nr:gamma-glutamyltransferase family protein [Siminovitchia thermophila]MBM7714255.1 gamma-glutamyltranspeptidase/glutathione hydrolase [Siminovitchia thermophila]ONK22164.1 gamma-glutamyltransferase [Bacillus sp. VT-16-64]
MITCNHLSHPYPITRNSAYAKNGVVATSQPLAAQAGLAILQKGGNAIDAAIATAACLTVCEPTSNGIGGDAFALVWTKGKLHGLNGSGRAPKHISIEKVKQMGYDAMPKFGWIPVTVPGVPGAWAELSRRFGKLPLKEVLKDAITYAEEGYPVSPTLSRFWKKAYLAFSQHLKEDMFKYWFDTFAPNNRAPSVGEVWSSKDHAATLRMIAETDGKSFYHGEIADKIVQFSKETGGFFTEEDLAEYEPEWVEPIGIHYRGYDVWEIPPNGQGIVALQALNILKGFEFASKESLDTYHKQIEAMKLAYVDGYKFITDLERMTYSVEEILSEAYAEERRKLISAEACLPQPGEPFKGGTVYLATADKEGNMVSFIQSNYMGFGSGLVVPGTGIALQNRGNNFSLDPTHVNALEGGKKTFHTIIPGFLTKGGQAVGPFGVMGGFMQPQGHVQVIMNSIDFGLHPQAALDAPRWQWIKGRTVEVEQRFPHHIAGDLAYLGHDIRIALETNNFGRGQIIWRDPETGVLVAGTESRTDGAIALW